jgi:hypothetical protein
LKTNFNCQSCGNRNFSIVATRLMIEKSEGGHLICHMLKTFQKHMTCPLVLAIAKNWSPWDNGGVSNGNQKISIAIWRNPTIEWWLKHFNHPRGHRGKSFFQKWYYIHLHLFWWQKISIAIQHTPIVRWWPKGVGLMLPFWGKKILPQVFFLRQPKNLVTI